MTKPRPGTKKTFTPEGERYAPLSKILRLVAVLESTQGMTTTDLLAGQSLPRKTFDRYRKAIESAGLPLVSETRGKEKAWRILPDNRRHAIQIRQPQAVALLIQQRGTRFLAGTGFDELLKDVYRQAEATLTAPELARVRDLDRKIYDRNDEALERTADADNVSALVSALLYSEPVTVTRPAKGKPARDEELVIRPYTLLIYRKGLYLIGFSETHGAVRRFALDRFTSVERQRGKRFAYPTATEYEPAAYLGDAFGIAGDESPSLVRIRFRGPTALEAVDRRRMHPSQTWETPKPTRDGGRVLAMTVAADDRDLDRWVMGFGADAEVLAPASLRARIAGQLHDAGARYGLKTVPRSTELLTGTGAALSSVRRGARREK
jgi:predicted DNA-binding transcriptional regulator YafY